MIAVFVGVERLAVLVGLLTIGAYDAAIRPVDWLLGNGILVVHGD